MGNTFSSCKDRDLQSPRLDCMEIRKMFLTQTSEKIVRNGSMLNGPENYLRYWSCYKRRKTKENWMNLFEMKFQRFIAQLVKLHFYLRKNLQQPQMDTEWIFSNVGISVDFLSLFVFIVFVLFKWVIVTLIWSR